MSRIRLTTPGPRTATHLMHRVIGAVVRAAAAAVPVVAVMGLHKLTAGDGYTYLTRQVAAHDATETGHRSLGDYYDEKGESPGRWLGSGLAGARPAARRVRHRRADEGPVRRRTPPQRCGAGGGGRGPGRRGQVRRRPPARSGGRSTCTTRPRRSTPEVARAFTTHNHDHGTAWNAADPRRGAGSDPYRGGQPTCSPSTTVAPPQDARELSGFVARASRQATSAVAGYDLTFSPVKSVSVLWALAPPSVADQVREAHHAAVADTLRWLEREAAVHPCRTRRRPPGRHPGLVAAAFTHRDSRAGDPDLHTHVAVSNKVQTLERPGRPLARPRRPDRSTRPTSRPPSGTTPASKPSSPRGSV